MDHRLVKPGGDHGGCGGGSGVVVACGGVDEGKMPEQVKDNGQGAIPHPGFTAEDRRRRLDEWVRWSMELALKRIRGNE